jgi:glycosyltransferase involved in cell wall biosynthesis
VADALQTALAQTAPPSRFDILVVDDGSTDATRWILDSYRERVQIVKLPKNRGLSAACNEGLRHIETPWFVRVDTDDWADRELVASLLDCQQATRADLVYADRWEQLPNGRRGLRRLTNPPRVDELIAAGTLLPTELVRELGGYRDLFWEEIDLYLRLLESGRCKIAHLPRPLYTYKVHRSDQMTADEEAVRMGWEQLRDLWPAEILAAHLRPVPLKGADSHRVSHAHT